MLHHFQLLWASGTDAKTVLVRQNQHNISDMPSAAEMKRILGMINLHLSPLRGQGVVSEVLVAAGVKVDAPRSEV